MCAVTMTDNDSAKHTYNQPQRCDQSLLPITLEQVDKGRSSRVPKTFHNSSLEQTVLISLTFSEFPENAAVALSTERLHHRVNCWYLHAQSEYQRAVCDDALIW